MSSRLIDRSYRRFLQMRIECDMLKYKSQMQILYRAFCYELIILYN